MRIWSLHPTYLDAQGLTALWREALLAKKVLEGNLKRYQNHPQLIRFKSLEKPVTAINYYLSEVYKEAKKRGYKFDKSKVGKVDRTIKVNVNSGQLLYEKQHLLYKLLNRTPEKVPDLTTSDEILQHPMFKVKEGPIEIWETI